MGRGDGLDKGELVLNFISEIWFLYYSCILNVHFGWNLIYHLKTILIQICMFKYK